MKQMWKEKWLGMEVSILALLGFGLRRELYACGMDEKNLLRSGHPLEIALWAVTGLMVVLVLAAARKQERQGAESPGWMASIGQLLCGGGILLTVLLNHPGILGIVGQLWRYFGFASGILLLWAAIDRARGEIPFFLTHLVPSIFFALHMVVHYQRWCSDPQLQNYVFAFLSTIGMMFFCYYHAAEEVGRGKRKLLMASGLVTGYLCVVNLASTEYLFLYLGSAAWTLLDFSRGGQQTAPRKAGGEDEST